MRWLAEAAVSLALATGGIALAQSERASASGRDVQAAMARATLPQEVRGALTQATGSARSAIREVGQSIGVPSCPASLARSDGSCLPSNIAGRLGDRALGLKYDPALFGTDRASSASYALYRGFLLPVGDAVGAGYIPLLGGALSVGQPWPDAYPAEVLPARLSDYFHLGERDDYRYADNVIYRIDPDTKIIESIAALLTGSDFAIGAPLPPGFDVYNVPTAFRERYRDSAEALYRYADGRIFQIDPRTMVVERAIEMPS